MPIDRLTLAEIDRRIQAELPMASKSEPLRRTLYTPLARALSGGVHALFGYQAWIEKQLFPQTCDPETLLNVHVPIWLKEGRKPPVAATGKIRLTGSVGYSVPQGTLLNRSDGMAFVLTEGIIIKESGFADAHVIATEPNAAGNTETEAKLRLANPIPGIVGEVSVLSPGLSGGADIEDIEALRMRVITSRRNGKDVGRGIDYEAWAKEVPGVTRAWAAPKLMGLGSITIFFVRDQDEEIFPDASECLAVQTHLDETGTPIGEVFAVGPKRRIQNFEIKLYPDSPVVRENVRKALASLLKSRASPVLCNPKSGKTAVPLSGITIPKSHLNEAISGATDEYDHELIAPEGAIECEVGELIELGEITWVQ